jgi:5-methylcytosine-specific restriction endonuclease McrA
MRNIFQSKTKTTTACSCQQCGATFFAYYTSTGKGKYCSQTCFRASRQVSLVCDYCKTSFSRTKSSVSRYRGLNYCSRECNNLGRRKNPDRIAIKRLRYGSSEFRAARRKVIERDGVCQICNSALANSVHHIDWKPYNNQLDNLVLLCKSCHGRLRRWEDWEVAKGRIMACSELHGDMQSATEMLAPA